MESAETIILQPKDFEDNHRLAAKVFRRDPSSPGRPTKEETEFREFLTDFRHYQALKETGVFDKFFKELKGVSDESDSGRSTGRSVRDRNKSGFGLLSGLLGGKTDILKAFTEETLQETIKAAAVTYGPIVALVVGWWAAETHIKIPVGKDKDGKDIMEPIPPVLHTSFSILIQVLRLLDVLGSLVASGFGGPFDFIKDPIGTVLEGPIDLISTLLGLPPADETPEQKVVRKARVLEKNIELQEKITATVATSGKGRF